VRIRIAIGAAVLSFAAALARAAQPEWGIAAGYGFALRLSGAAETREYVLMVAPSAAWRLSSRLEYVAEGHLAGYLAPSGYMLGVVPLGARLSIGSGAARPYFELGAGCGWTDLNEIPEISRRFNFILQGGVGARRMFADGRGWTLEARLSHYSNANTVRPNISLNCLVVLAGWRFR